MERVPVQRGLFAGPCGVVSADLYAAVVRGSAARTRAALTVEPASLVSGNTYFGRFPASHWQRWTGVERISVELTVTGDGRLDLSASDVDGLARVVSSVPVVAADAAAVTLTAALDRFVDGGALWLDAETEAGQRLTVERVRWTVAGPTGRHEAGTAGHRGGERRGVAVVICTCDRTADCVATLRALAADPDCVGAVGAVIVVDQGREPVAEAAGFDDAARALDGRLRTLRQPNLGGAGGFTRGMIEAASMIDPAGAARAATRDGGADPATDVLLMDDDVLLEPDLVVRMTAFAGRAVHPVIVGGQMLDLWHPTRLHAEAEVTDLAAARPGEPAPGSRKAVDMVAPDPATGRPYRQERRFDAGYNGWWACLVPAEVVAAVGYPLPLFFQGDDAEYSYRARERGYPTVTLPGAGLWHTDFAWKDTDELNRYFIVRNYTIISALHGGLRRRVLLPALAREVATALLGAQYGLAATVVRAVEDFLAGPEILADGGTAALRGVRALRAGYPETRMWPVTGPPGIRPGDLAIVAAPGEPVPGAPARWWRALGVLLGRHRYPTGALAHDLASWWRVSRCATAVVTDASQRGVRVRRYDRRRMAGVAVRAVTALAWLAVTGPAAARRYRTAAPRLAAPEQWRRRWETPEPASGSPEPAGGVPEPAQVSGSPEVRDAVR